MNRSGEIACELDAISAVLARAGTELEAGTILDLSPLEGRVDDLCHRLQGLPATEGHALRGRLLGLIDDLSRLARLIEAKRDELKRRMPKDGGHRQAASAYAKGAKR